MKRRLRVLTIGHSYVVRLNRSVAARLSEDPSIEMTVAAPSFFRGDLRDLEMEGEDVPPPYELRSIHTFASRWVHLFRYRQDELHRLVRGRGWDVVHMWEEPYVFAGYQIGRAVRPTASRFFFRTAQSRVKRYPPPFAQFERSVLRRAQGWVAGGELVHRAMLSKGFPERHSKVIPLGVCTDTFRPATAEAVEAVRKELGLQGPVVGFVGRLVAEKGLHVLMSALEGVDPPWSLLVLGTGPMQKELESWARRRGWSNRLRILLARHADVPKYVGAMDMLVAPSQTAPHWSEQFGRMIIEAFACGVPVIGSDSGEVPFVVADAGRIVAEGDVAAWTRAISEWLADPAEGRRYGASGLARCRAVYSASTVAKAYATYYDELMQTGREEAQ